jgi:drug/metabolite transporter (DMT)-like permease
MRSGALAGVLWMLVAQALFGVMGVTGRLGSGGVPWQEVVFARFLVGAITAWLVARMRGQSLGVTNRRLQFLRTLFGTLSALGTFFLLSAREIALGDLVTVFGTSPVFVALMSWPLLGERVHKREWLAIAVAFAGIIVIAKPTLDTAPLLVVVGLLTALSTAFAMISIRKMGSEESSEAIVFQFSCAGTLVALLVSIPVWKTPDLKSGLLLLATGMAGGLAQIAMTRAYTKDSAARISAITYSGIIFTRLFAVPVFGEIPGWLQIAGSALVIGAGVMLARTKAPEI